MSQGVVCDSKAKADAYGAAMDAKMGYPRDGVEIGGGVHASKAEGRTYRHADVIAHPTLPQWAYPYDALVQYQAIALPAGASVATLDPTWFPVVAVVGAVVAQADAEVPP